MERFVIIVNGWKPLTIITKRSILDVAAALDPPLSTTNYFLPMLPMTELVILLVELTKEINLQHLFVKKQIVWNFQEI